VKKCSLRQFRGDDGNCHPVGSVKCNCGGNMYCEPDGECCNDIWYDLCPSGFYRETDCTCQEFIRTIPTTLRQDPMTCAPYLGRFCSAGYNCCETNGRCYTPCPYGTWDARDCTCWVLV
jgi:hypothetical protein